MTDQSPSRFRPHPLLIVVGLGLAAIAAGVLVAELASAVAGLLLSLMGVA
jgi:hypothetical protein